MIYMGLGQCTPIASLFRDQQNSGVSGIRHPHFAALAQSVELVTFNH
jgi:hypothetical protein